MRGKWCAWADTTCPPRCPIPSVDNSGNPYPACALVRLKSPAEVEAATAEASPRVVERRGLRGKG